MAKDSHAITGERSWFMDSFDLPTHNADDLKNFEGPDEKTYYTLEEIQKGDHGTQEKFGGGMTETDADTSGKKDGPYTRINKKKGRWTHAPKNKLSAKVDMYNTERSTGFGKLVF